MSKRQESRAKARDISTRFQVKPVFGGEVAAIVLDELSRNYGNLCNYTEAVRLARAGDLYLALCSVEAHNEMRGAASSPLQHWVYNQALSVLKKQADSQLDRWEATREKWFATEHRCARINQKILALVNRRHRGQKLVPFKRDLYRFYEAVHHVLGDNPPLDEIAEAAHYGPGSTSSVKGANVGYVRKMEANECVPLAVDLAAQALMHDKACWAHLGMDPVYAGNPDAREGFIRVAREWLSASVVSEDTLMFIHKSMTALRSISAQPTCSGMLQLGVHSVVEPLLERVGVTIRDQSRNQRMARQGSLEALNGHKDPIVTLDKTDASSFLAANLITYFFPPAWAKLLNRIRTPRYLAPKELGGGTHDYAMYAGMGNGTTFVVETLVFWAMTYATSSAKSVDEYVATGTYAVYGDDVILRKKHAVRYIALAEYLGFVISEEKSFLDGPFRESCGADYYNGTNVRPAIINTDGQRMGELEIVGFHNTLADGPYPLKDACRRVRGLWKQRINPSVPTDPQGNLGFRPVDTHGYTMVLKGTTPLVSSIWQRPRYYTLDVRPKWGDLGEIDAWTQLAVALLRSRQEDKLSDNRWAMPLRDLVSVRVVPERDTSREVELTRLRNTLARLSVWKSQPWWEAYRG